MTPNIWSKLSFTYLWIDMSRDMPPPLGIAGIRHISGYPLRVPLRVGQLEPNSGRYSAKPIELPNMQGNQKVPFRTILGWPCGYCRPLPRMPKRASVDCVLLGCLGEVTATVASHNGKGVWRHI